MQCPVCGGDSGSVALVVGVVKIITFHCKECHKVWRKKELTVQFHASMIEKEIRKLKETRDITASSTRIAIQFLQVKLDSHAADCLDEDSAKSKRRNDLWERRYLQSMLGDDYV